MITYVMTHMYATNKGSPHPSLEWWSRPCQQGIATSFTGMVVPLRYTLYRLHCNIRLTEYMLRKGEGGTAVCLWGCCIEPRVVEVTTPDTPLAALVFGRGLCGPMGPQGPLRTFALRNYGHFGSSAWSCLSSFPHPLPPYVVPRGCYVQEWSIGSLPGRGP